MTPQRFNPGLPRQLFRNVDGRIDRNSCFPQGSSVSSIAHNKCVVGKSTHLKKVEKDVHDDSKLLMQNGFFP